MVSIRLILVAAVLAGFANAQSFHDSFDKGSLDASTWAVTDGKAPGASTQHAGVFNPENLDFSNGMLRIKLTQTRDSKSIHSCGGEIRSRQKFGYGVYQFTIRAASTAENPYAPGRAVSGGVSAGFSFFNNSQTELDVEANGSEPSSVHFTTWINEHPEAPPDVKQSDESPVSGHSEQFHTYSYAWYPGRVEYFTDGQLVAVHKRNVPTEPAHILINHWGTDNEHWGGHATPGVTRYMYVKSVSFVPMEKR